MVRVEERVIQVRAMQPEDLTAVRAIEAKTFSQPWTEQVFVDELAAPRRTYLVAEAVDAETGETAIVGYAGLMVVAEDGHVTTVAVDPAARRGAIGSRLLVKLIDRAVAEGADHLTLEVRASNANAQRFYQKFGMAPVGVRKNYYKDEDALIMWVHDIAGEHYGELLARIEEGLS